jgi:hypothetical protein
MTKLAKMLLIVALCAIPAKAEGDIYRFIFSNSMEKEEPANIISEHSMGDNPIYIFTYWKALTVQKDYEFTCRIYDGAGTLVFDSPYRAKVDNPNWYTWWSYYPKKVDKPGKYKVEILLENRLKTEKYLSVRPSESKAVQELLPQKPSPKDLTIFGLLLFILRKKVFGGISVIAKLPINILRALKKHSTA